MQFPFFPVRFRLTLLPHIHIKPKSPISPHILDLSPSAVMGYQRPTWVIYMDKILKQRASLFNVTVERQCQKAKEVLNRRYSQKRKSNRKNEGTRPPPPRRRRTAASTGKKAADTSSGRYQLPCFRVCMHAKNVCTTCMHSSCMCVCIHPSTRSDYSRNGQAQG